MRRVLFACVAAALLVLAGALFPAVADDSGWVITSDFLSYHRGDIVTDPAVIADLESRGYGGERWFGRFGTPLSPPAPVAAPTDVSATVATATSTSSPDKSLTRGTAGFTWALAADTTNAGITITATPPNSNTWDCSATLGPSTEVS